jgi:hypothetical protein
MADIGLNNLSQGTAASANVTPAPGLHTPQTRTIEERAQELTERAGYLRNQSAILTDDLAATHLNSFRVQLDARTAQLAKRDPVDLIDEIAELGFAWRDIARMLGVSVPAVRRWRLGEKPSGENRRAIACLLAFTQIISDQVFEPASWMEVPISSEAPTTAIDLYAAGHVDIAFDLATGNRSSDSALDAVAPNWRERYRSEWEVGTAEDGQPYIRPKTGQ